MNFNSLISEKLMTKQKNIKNKKFHKITTEKTLESIKKNSPEKVVNYEERITFLNQQIKVLKLSTKEEREQIETIQNEINSLVTKLKELDNTKELIKLDNLNIISLKIDKLKLNKYNLQTLFKYIQLYSIAFFTTVDKAEEVQELKIHSVIEDETVYISQNTDLYSLHLLEQNNIIADSVNNKKWKSIINIAWNKFKNTIGLGEFSLIILD
jgi:uncharacterized coiled-coil protein SlyX